MSIQNDPAANEDVLVDLEVTGICRLVDHDEEIVFLLETSIRSTMCQMDHPTLPQEQRCSHCDSVEASYWSRSLESDAMIRADYTLTTTMCVKQTWYSERNEKDVPA